MPEIQFESLAAFLDMGGYAFYVWTAYAFFAVVMGWNLVLPLLDKRKVMKLLQARMQRDAARGQSAGAGE
jgi:heme exporter protein D